MKKISLLVLSLLLLLPFTTVMAKTKEPIKVYVFYLETCPHCKDLHEYLDELKSSKSYKNMFETVYYEVSSAKNYYLMMDVAEYLNADVGGVPFFVIGTKYFNGFGDKSKSVIKKEIENNYGNKNYEDIVANIESEDNSFYDDDEDFDVEEDEDEDKNTGKVNKNDKEEASFDEESKEKKDYTTYILVGVIAVLVVAIIWIKKN